MTTGQRIHQALIAAFLIAYIPMTTWTPVVPNVALSDRVRLINNILRVEPWVAPSPRTSVGGGSVGFLVGEICTSHVMDYSPADGPTIVAVSWAYIDLPALLRALLIYPVVYVLFRRWRDARIERRWRSGQCLGCGYDLILNTSGVCPECGHDRLVNASPFRPTLEYELNYNEHA